MGEMLYKKEMKGKRVTYTPVVDDSQPTIINLTDAQCLTAAGSLGLTLLCLFERHIPPHKRVAKKIKAVEQAILQLYHGTGEDIDPELADQFCRAWDRAMLEMAA
jgi:hypothetical protein